jgi:uncharacterized protein YkwD
VPTPRKRLLSALAALLSLALVAIAPAIASATTRHHHATRAGCIARSAAAARTRARTAVRGCHTSVHKARAHQPKAHNAPPKAPATTSATGHGNTVTETAATIAEVLATPCQNTELTPTAGSLPLVRAAVLCLINQERAQNGRNPLTLNASLEQAAEGHCTELIADDYFAHVSPSGETPVQRIAATGYIPGPSAGYAIGENLAWGTLSLSTPKAIVAAWIASPGHLANILESQYTETGIGVTPAVPASLGEGEPGASYAQEFGVIIN